jgi:hypothetical protein
MECKNHLKQYGLALHNYHTAHGQLPISIAYEVGSGKGWILSILPQVEQQALYDQFTPGFEGNYPTAGLMKMECRDAMKTPIPLLHCPSDPSERKTSTDQWQWPSIEVTLTSYKGVMGDNRMGGSSRVQDGSEPDCHLTLMAGETRPRYFPCSAAYFSNGDYASTYAPSITSPIRLQRPIGGTTGAFPATTPAGRIFVWRMAACTFFPNPLIRCCIRS